MGKPTGFLEYERKSQPAVPPLTRITNWEEFHQPLTEKERRIQAARCMSCGVPFCQAGMEIMAREKVAIDEVYGHGGLFKTEGVGQNLLAAAIHAPVTVMETAGEGGAWGIALLASYMVAKAEGETLEDFLSKRVFASMPKKTVAPDPALVAERFGEGAPEHDTAIFDGMVPIDLKVAFRFHG